MLNNKVFAGNIDDLRVWGRQSWQRKNGNLHDIDIMGKERLMNTWVHSVFKSGREKENHAKLRSVALSLT